MEESDGKRSTVMVASNACMSAWLHLWNTARNTAVFNESDTLKLHLLYILKLELLYSQDFSSLYREA